MHFEIVPITEDGRLSAKDVVGNKKALASFQDKFNEYVNERGYELALLVKFLKALKLFLHSL